MNIFYRIVAILLVSCLAIDSLLGVAPMRDLPHSSPHVLSFSAGITDQAVVEPLEAFLLPFQKKAALFVDHGVGARWRIAQPLDEWITYGDLLGRTEHSFLRRWAVIP